MKKWLISLVLVAGLSGCSTFMPKKVELFQRKVKEFPKETEQYEEVRRQAATAVVIELEEMLSAAYAEDCSIAVVRPGEGALALAQSVSLSLGPPRHFPAGFSLLSVLSLSDRPTLVDATKLSRKLEIEVARHNVRLGKFEDYNDQDTGKKIEGTGIVKVPYFAWVGGALFLLVVLYMAGRAALGVLATMNPTVGVGLNALQLGGRAVGSMFSQLIKGGETFKKKLDSVVDDEKVRARVKELFRQEQMQAQDAQTQEVVKHLTKD